MKNGIEGLEGVKGIEGVEGRMEYWNNEEVEELKNCVFADCRLWTADWFDTNNNL